MTLGERELTRKELRVVALIFTVVWGILFWTTWAVTSRRDEDARRVEEFRRETKAERADFYKKADE